MNRTLNQAARNLIVEYEGIRLHRYTDAAGLATIGIGHLIKPGDAIGDDITQEQCDALFERDLSIAARAASLLVDVPLTDNQFGALVSFVFNLGANALERSTLRKKLNARDYAGAAEEFGKWVYAGGVTSEGLFARRDAEKELFLTDETGDES